MKWSCFVHLSQLQLEPVEAYTRQRHRTKTDLSQTGTPCRNFHKTLGRNFLTDGPNKKEKNKTVFFYKEFVTFSVLTEILHCNDIVIVDACFHVCVWILCITFFHNYFVSVLYIEMCTVVQRRLLTNV